MELTLFHKCVFEFLGTMVLVLMGAQGAGWVVISLAWGLAVMCGVFIAGPYSGAHLNPAVSVGLALAGQFAWGAVLPYVAAQMLGGFAGAVLVYAFYVDHFAATADNPDGMLVRCWSMPSMWIILPPRPITLTGCWAVSAPCRPSITGR